MIAEPNDMKYETGTRPNIDSLERPRRQTNLVRVWWALVPTHVPWILTYQWAQAAI